MQITPMVDPKSTSMQEGVNESPIAQTKLISGKGTPFIKTNNVKHNNVQELPAPREGSWYTAKELLSLELKEYPTLWGKVLPAVGLAILAGSSDCGKSSLTRELAFAVSKGEETFLNLPLKTQRKKAFIYSTEDDEHSVAYNLHCRFAKHKHDDFTQRLHVCFYKENYIRELDNFLTSNPCDIGILDSLGDMLKGSANDLMAVRNTLIPLGELARKHQCLFVIIHHTTKNSEKAAPDKNKLNGSQGIEAKARCVLQLTATPNTNERVLSIVKCNHLSEQKKNTSIILEIDSNTRLFKNTGKTVDRSSVGSQTTKKFDSNEWAKRFFDAKEKMNESYDKTRKFLEEKYSSEEVPSVTWFKENCKSGLPEAPSLVEEKPNDNIKITNSNEE